MQIKVITAANAVYATYRKTIAYSKAYTNEFERILAEREARCIAFGYACGAANAWCDRVRIEGNMTDADVFAYLDKTHKA